jgi:hypothetical protein
MKGGGMSFIAGSLSLVSIKMPSDLLVESRGDKRSFLSDQSFFSDFLAHLDFFPKDVS